MALTDDEASNAFEALVTAIDKTDGLRWLAVQIREETDFGRLVQEPAAIIYEDDSDAGEPMRRKSGKPPKLLATAKYSTQEKLRIAVEATQAVIVGSVRIQETLLRDIKELEGESGGVVFSVSFDPAEDNAVGRHVIDAEHLPAISAAADRLSNLLQELLAETVNAN